MRNSNIPQMTAIRPLCLQPNTPALSTPSPMKCLRYLIFIFAVLGLFASCNKTRGRNGVLSEKAMADVLYEYQIATGLASQISSGDSAAILQYKYTQAVLAKYGLTSEEFDMSMAHYARNPKTMAKLAKEVENRLTEEIESEQESIVALRKEKFAQQTDTISAWENREGAMLSANGYNTFTHTVKGKDLKGGTRLIFSAKAKWLYRETSRAGVMSITVTYENDSTEVHTEVIRESHHSQNVLVILPDNKKVKEVRMQVTQCAGWRKDPQLLSLTNMVLWSIKKEKNE